MGLFFPTGTWTSRHFIPMDTPRKKKKTPENPFKHSFLLQGLTLWKIFNESFKHHLLQFHSFMWNKAGQVRGGQSDFPVPCWTWASSLWATWCGGQGACLSQTQLTPMHVSGSAWLTMQTQELHKFPGQEGQVTQLTAFSKSCYPGQSKMIMKHNLKYVKYVWNHIFLLFFQ